MRVLDASALLALILDEPGADTVAGILSGALVSVLTIAEVLSAAARWGTDPASVLKQMERSSIEIVPLTLEQTLLAAQLLVPTRHLGLSLGDRCCLALAIQTQLPVYTADRVWAKLDLSIPIHLVR